MATFSSILAWEITWTEEPCRLQYIGSQRVGHNWATDDTLQHLEYTALNKKILNKAKGKYGPFTRKKRKQLAQTLD